MSEKKRFVQSKYANHLQDIKTDTHYYLTSEKIGCKDLFDEIERLTEENEQLKKRVDKLKVIMAEFGATLLMNGFDIEVDDKDLMEMINNE